jgi:hypothetical protein
MAASAAPATTTASAAAVVARLELPETPVAGPGRYDAHLQPMRSFIRCMVSAQAEGLARVAASAERLADPPRLTMPAFQRLAARLTDLVAVRTTFAKWKTALSLNWGHLGPEDELLSFKEMLAVTIGHDLQLEALTARMASSLAAVHDALAARDGAAAAAATVAGTAATTAAAAVAVSDASARLADACAVLYHQLGEFASVKRQALTYDATRLLPWSSRVFDKRLSEHALQRLLYGDTVPLREAASVARWALRNQADPRSKQVGIAGGDGASMGARRWGARPPSRLCTRLTRPPTRTPTPCTRSASRRRWRAGWALSARRTCSSTAGAWRGPAPEAAPR